MSAALLARLEALPPTRALWGRIALLSLGGFFEFYDLFLAGYVAPGLTRAHILTTAPGWDSVATFIAVFFAGLFLGTALFGVLADRMGRRAIFTFSLLWYCAAAVAMACQSTALGLDVCRFVAGIGIGIELVTIDTYIAELVPPAIRGRAFALSNVIQFLAIPLVALLAYLLVPIAPFGVAGWRWVILAGAAGALVVWWIRLGVPESPRWLLGHGHDQDAEAIIAAWEEDVRREGRRLLPVKAQDDLAREKGRFVEIFRPPYRRRSLMLIAFNLFQAAGYYGFASWAPTLLISQGVEVTKSLAYTFIMALAAPVGPLIGYLFTDRIERKWVIVGAALAIAAAGLGFAMARAALGVIACGFALTLANNILSFAYHGYQPELFPTRIRARAVGFVYSFSRLATMASSFVIAALLARFGAPGVFVFIAGCMVLVAAIIALWGPHTRGRSLEAISQ